MRPHGRRYSIGSSKGALPLLEQGRDAFAKETTGSFRLSPGIASRSTVETEGAPGFTLLEIILAMFVLVLLVSGIFAIVGGTTQLADEMTRAHERDARRHSFAVFCGRMLRTLPGSAQVRFRTKQEGNHYLGELALKNAPSPIGNMGANGMTLLRTEQMPDGYLRVVLEMIPSDEMEGGGRGRGEAVKQRLILLEGVAKCEWKFFNPMSREWEPVWNDKLTFGLAAGSDSVESTVESTQRKTITSIARRPGLVELNLAIGADAPQRFVFWVPPASQPGGFVYTPQNPSQAPPPSP